MARAIASHEANVLSQTEGISREAKLTYLPSMMAALSVMETASTSGRFSEATLVVGQRCHRSTSAAEACNETPADRLSSSEGELSKEWLMSYRSSKLCQRSTAIGLLGPLVRSYSSSSAGGCGRRQQASVSLVAWRFLARIPHLVAAQHVHADPGGRVPRGGCHHGWCLLAMLSRPGSQAV